MAGYATRSLAFHYFPMLFLNYLMYSCAAHFDNFLVDFDAQQCKLRQEQEQFILIVIVIVSYATVCRVRGSVRVVSTIVCFIAVSTLVTGLL